MTHAPRTACVHWLLWTQQTKASLFLLMSLNNLALYISIRKFVSKKLAIIIDAFTIIVLLYTWKYRKNET